VSILSKVKALVTDPPPEYVFEISEQGIAWARPDEPAAIQWRALPQGVIEANPLKDNVLSPGQFAEAITALVPRNGSRGLKRAALILPDYAARIAVLDFDTFPSDPHEQLALARFRAKRAVPFDIESAVVACHAQPRPGEKKVDVTVGVVKSEVAAHYEAPFRAAGIHCGLLTISALQALPLAPETPPPGDAPIIEAKLSGRVLAVSLLNGGSLRMFRCVELPSLDEREIFDILIPTLAFAEDELASRPGALLLCGFPAAASRDLEQWSSALGLPVCPVRSRLGAVNANNAGLLGYLESLEGL
jgi:type IV pilus assembly protein PilM